MRSKLPMAESLEAPINELQQIAEGDFNYIFSAFHFALTLTCGWLEQMFSQLLQSCDVYTGHSQNV